MADAARVILQRSVPLLPSGGRIQDRLVKDVTVHAEPNASGFSIEIKGRLNQPGWMMVAREGLEPPTPGL